MLLTLSGMTGLFMICSSGSQGTQDQGCLNAGSCVSLCSASLLLSFTHHDVMSCHVNLACLLPLQLRRAGKSIQMRPRHNLRIHLLCILICINTLLSILSTPVKAIICPLEFPFNLLAWFPYHFLMSHPLLPLQISSLAFSSTELPSHLQPGPLQL